MDITLEASVLFLSELFIINNINRHKQSNLILMHYIMRVL